MFEVQPPASLLEAISIAAPCQVDWDSMTGDEQVRFCGECRMNVYNLSGMSREEAEGLIRGHEGRLCVRYFQRSDGTVITRDCPVGLRALHRRKLKRIGQLAAVVTLITVAGSFCVSLAGSGGSMEMQGGIKVPNNIHENRMLMGDVAFPPQEIKGEMVAPATPPGAPSSVSKQVPKSTQTAKPSKKRNPSPKPATKSSVQPKAEFILGQLVAPPQSQPQSESPTPKKL